MPFQIIKPDSHWDFLGKRRICLSISLTLIVLGLLAIPVRGMRMGVDFAGGTEIQLRFAEGTVVDEGDIRAAASGIGIENPTVVRFGTTGNEFLLKFRGDATGDGLPQVSADAPAEAAAEATAEENIANAAEEAVAEIAPADEGVKPSGTGGSAATARVQLIREIEDAIDRDVAEASIERVEFVGPKVGAELRRSGLLALGVACLFILAYIAFRFSARFAPGAVLALVHDVLITSGLWVLFGLEFDLRVLAALLAIIGYSLNDTIIVYDRIRENMEARTKYDLLDVLNQSVNQTLSRTLLTSITTMVALMCLLILGGQVIRPFALAMAMGILVGTFSSIYVAAPVLLFLEQRAKKA